jgi:hypothetical protein
MELVLLEIISIEKKSFYWKACPFIGNPVLTVGNYVLLLEIMLILHIRTNAL